VVNMASISHNHGVVDYFHPADGATKSVEKEGITLGAKEAFKRYGSSKLLLTMVGYALQRRLDMVSDLPFVPRRYRLQLKLTPDRTKHPQTFKL
jgi:hypothetical protein